MADSPIKQLAVDLVEVRRISADLRVQADTGLASGLGGFAREVERGVLFGTFSPSGEAQAARSAFWAALRRHRDNAEQQLRLGRAFAAALEQVLTNYTDADDLAAAALKVIDREIAYAAKRAEHAELRHQQGRGEYV